MQSTLSTFVLAFAITTMGETTPLHVTDGEIAVASKIPTVKVELNETIPKTGVGLTVMEVDDLCTAPEFYTQWKQYLRKEIKVSREDGVKIRKTYVREIKKVQRRAKDIIEEVAKKEGLNKTATKLLLVWADRESSYLPWVWHRLEGDLKASQKAWARVRARDLYKEVQDFEYIAMAITEESGMEFDKSWVRRTICKPKRSSKDTECRPYQRENRYAENPYWDDAPLWSNGGRGLFGLNVVFHLHRWDPNAHPNVLCDPYVATTAVIRLARTGMLEMERQNEKKARKCKKDPEYKAIFGCDMLKPTVLNLNRYFGASKFVRRDLMDHKFEKRATHWKLSVNAITDWGEGSASKTKSQEKFLIKIRDPALDSIFKPRSLDSEVLSLRQTIN